MAGEDLKARIRGQYDREALIDIDVPEWDLKVYFRPLNLEEKSKLNHWRLAQNTERGLEVFAKTIIMKALDENGKPLFDNKDLTFLMREADPDVVMALSANLVRVEEVVDQKKD